ncbi:hypothetical protein P7C73_g5170, partial [Tremellales sp. Uapishka_1]
MKRTPMINIGTLLARPTIAKADHSSVHHAGSRLRNKAILVGRTLQTRPFLMPPLCRQGRLSIAILLLLPPITLAIDPSSKRGLAWPNGNYVPISTFDTSNTSISSYYTWSPDPISDSPFPFIPMLWGANETYIDPFNTALNESFWNVSLTAERVLLGFNEPDNVGQSNVSPSEGAATWINVLEPLKREGYRLGSPAITSAPSGKNWLLDWWDECAGGCNPDFVVLHWYNLRADDFIDYLTDFYNTFGLPIWVTGEPGQADLEGQLTPSIEYAVQDFSDNSTVATLAEIQNFMNLTTAFMEATEWVERYFWFGAMYDMV